MKRLAILIAKWAGRGLFKTTALIAAFIIIVAAVTHLLPANWASRAESALRIFGADRALLLVEGIALAKLIMLAVAYPFRRGR